MIGPRLRILLLVLITVFVGVEIAQSAVWLKHELGRSFSYVDGFRNPVWLGPVGNLFQALVQGGLLLALLSIDLRLQRNP